MTPPIKPPTEPPTEAHRKRRRGCASWLPVEHWAAIQHEWEYGPDRPSMQESARRAGEKYNFDPPSRMAVKNKIDHDGWTRHGSMEGITAAAQRKADRLVRADGTLEPSAPEALPAHEARQESEDKRAEVLARHRQAWRDVDGLRQKAITESLEDVREGATHARFAKIIAEVIKLQQEGERKAWGLDDIPALPDFTRMSDDDLRAIANQKAR